MPNEEQNIEMNSNAETNMPNNYNQPQENYDDPGNEQPQEIDDGNYINEPNIDSAGPTLSTAAEQREIKLYKLFRKLYEYISIYYDSFNVIQFDLLQPQQYKDLSALIKKVSKLKEDTNYYLNDLYINETYEKNLYTYVLMRTNFIELIKQIRIILKLKDQNNEDEHSDSEK